MACPIPLDGRNKNLIFIMLTATHIKNIKVIKVLFITYHRPDISVNLAALRSRCEHYILQLWFLSSFFPLPILSGPKLDVYHTFTHGVALVRI